jgi:hypothetical protein
LSNQLLAVSFERSAVSKQQQLWQIFHHLPWPLKQSAVSIQHSALGKSSIICHGL